MLVHRFLRADDPAATSFTISSYRESRRTVPREPAMTNLPRIPLPKGWPTQIKSAMLHVISLAQFSMAYTLGRGNKRLTRFS